MYSALALVLAALAIALMRPGKPIAVWIVVTALGIAIVTPWLGLGEPQYVWLANVHLVVTGRDDPIARFAIGLVGLIAAIVAIYALGDPEIDDDVPRFFTTYAIFVAAMFAFVDAATVLFAYACWEVMGVASFVLIGHRAHDTDAGTSARRAFTTTRVGDLSVLVGAALLASGRHEFGAATLVVGAAIKSGQLGVSPWLVGAMVAPTPVSALLHSATLVAAGPFLLARFVPLAQFPNVALALLAYAISSALAAALFAATSDDAKRTLAWSSIEQLAQAFVASAVGLPLVAFAVLAGHAIAKPALFFAAGMHRIATGSSRYETASRDARRLPAFGGAIAYGAIALVGIPPFLSASALARTWTGANRTHPGFLIIGAALAAIAGWYVARFAIRLNPLLARPFVAGRIGRASPIAVWAMVGAGIAVSLASVHVLSDLASLALPLAAVGAAAGCYALRERAIVMHGPLIPDGIARWDATFTRPILALTHTIAKTDRALATIADRIASAAFAAGGRVTAGDRAIDRATTAGARDIAIGGRRASALVGGNVSQYVGFSAIVFLAAGIAATAIVAIERTR
ncbi:MAG: hypothetical protein NVSMB19_21390 [Vulcanimicrobiaceae bacterium]